jgi:hypothetical protein
MRRNPEGRISAMNTSRESLGIKLVFDVFIFLVSFAFGISERKLASAVILSCLLVQN